MSNLILLASVFLPTAAVVMVLLAWRYFHRRDRRRSLLTFKVLNLPGEGLRKSIAKHDEAFHEATAIVMLAGPVVLASWLMARMDRVIEDWSAVQFGTVIS